MKKVISALLALLMIGGSLISCAQEDTDSGNASETTASAESTADSGETETRLYPDLPDITFDGTDFRYLHWEVVSWGENNSKDLDADAETGDLINDAVFRRNTVIEDTYGVKFSVEYQGHDVLKNTYTKMIASNEVAYDAVFPHIATSSSLIAEGTYYDLTQLPHVDFTQPWWDQRSVEDLSINNKLFLVASDITILDDDATSGIIFNKAMAQDYNSPDFYELVKTGKWTLDALVDATKGVAGDLNGDSVINEEDRYGIVGQLDFAHSCFIGAGSKFAEKDSDDLPYDSFYNERNVAVCEKILDIMYNTDNFYNAHKLPVKGNEVFANNQGLFKWIRLEDITKLRQYDVEFGILPTPKYDEQQDTYYSAVSSHNGTLITVPVIHNNPEMVGCVLEALAAESKYVLIPAYYDLTLISKGIRDEQSEEMLDIIVSQRSFDFGDIFGFGGFAETWLYMTYYDQKDIASLYEKTSKKIGNDIEKLIEKVLELE